MSGQGGRGFGRCSSDENIAAGFQECLAIMVGGDTKIYQRMDSTRGGDGLTMIYLCSLLMVQHL